MGTNMGCLKNTNTKRKRVFRVAFIKRNQEGKKVIGKLSTSMYDICVWISIYVCMHALIFLVLCMLSKYDTSFYNISVS